MGQNWLFVGKWRPTWQRSANLWLCRRCQCRSPPLLNWTTHKDAYRWKPVDEFVWELWPAKMQQIFANHSNMSKLWKYNFFATSNTKYVWFCVLIRSILTKNYSYRFVLCGAKTFLTRISDRSLEFCKSGLLTHNAGQHILHTTWRCNVQINPMPGANLLAPSQSKSGGSRAKFGTNLNPTW